jgi:hypothetical protein
MPVNLRDLDKLQHIENKLGQIRELLNPEDSPYVCDTIVTNIGDEDLWPLVEEMMKRMGYKKKMIARIQKIVKEIHS